MGSSLENPAMGMAFGVGCRVEFAPNPRFPDKTIKGKVVRHRFDPRLPSLRSTRLSRGRGTGWFDVLCDDGQERSVRPNRCETIFDEE